jgi:arylsulfatase A-like enzyme/Tfp pilus assembly protein PilF
MVAARAFALLLGALAAVSVACRSEPASTTSPSSAAGPIILVTIDTLRADRLGSYGSTKALTPALDRFAEGATRFTAAVTQVPLTLPAHATILTGLHPAKHGVRTNDGFRLGAGVPTLAEALRARGYATGAFIGGYPLQASFGLARGFDRYDDDFLRAPGTVERPADEVVRAAVAWIDQRRSQPFFAWLHLFDPHSPYTPPPPFAPTRADAGDAARYDGEVAYTDAALGRLFEHIQQSALSAGTAFVIAADHGESLGEHGERTHGTFLYDATVRVPLFIRLPGQTTPRTVAVPVEAADLAPTIAALAGASLGAVDGRSLLPLVSPEPAARDAAAGDPDRPAYAESYYQNVLLGWSPLRAVRTSRWKFIEAPRPELYDLAADPGEIVNRVGDRAALAAGLQRALPSSGTEATLASAQGSAGESAERLRSLGYVSGATLPSAAARAVDPKDRVEVWAAIEDGIDRLGRDPDGARQAFARALRLDPGNGLAMKYLADVSFRAGRDQEARDGYRRALAAGFRHPDAFVNLAAIAERHGRLDEARDALREAVTIGHADADAWNRLGLLEARRGAADEARRAFTGAISAEPGRSEPYYNLAIIERRAGNEAAAHARLLEALARNPAYPEAQYELGTGYLLAHQPEPALKAYRAALDARPDYAEALFGAARAALDLGRSDEARRDYERFVQVAPPEYRQQITAAKEALRGLERHR